MAPNHAHRRPMHDGQMPASEGGTAGMAMSGAGGDANTGAGSGGTNESMGGMAMSSAGTGVSVTAGNGGGTSVPSTGGMTASAGGCSVNSNGAGADDASQTNRCSCRVAPERHSNSWAALALLGLATATLRRRGRC